MASQVVLGLISGIFVFSGVMKVLSPTPLARALHELTRARSQPKENTEPPFAKAPAFIAGMEFLAAAGNMAVAVQPSPVFLLPSLVVAVGIVVAGAAGILRRSQLDCGCLGDLSTGPIGIHQVGIGSILIAGTLLPGLLVLNDRPTPESAVWFVMGLALASLGLTFWHLRRLLGPSLIALKRTWM